MSLLALLAAILLFALKFADARCLRLPRSTAGRVAVLLAVALVHHGALGLTADRAATLAAPAALLATAALATPADLRRRLRDGLRSMIGDAAADLHRLFGPVPAVAEFEPMAQRYAIAPPPRGPPAWV